MAITDTWAFASQGTNFTLKLEYDGNGNNVYSGWAIPGTATSAAGWRIMKQTFDGSNRLTDVQWAGGSVAFSAIWDNRASASFS